MVNYDMESIYFYFFLLTIEYVPLLADENPNRDAKNT
jgi:hypothetical protein